MRNSSVSLGCIHTHFSDVELQGKCGGRTMCLPTAGPWKLGCEHSRPGGRKSFLPSCWRQRPRGEGAGLAPGSSSRQAHFPSTFWPSDGCHTQEASWVQCRWHLSYSFFWELLILVRRQGQREAFCWSLEPPSALGQHLPCSTYPVPQSEGKDRGKAFCWSPESPSALGQHLPCSTGVWWRCTGFAAVWLSQKISYIDILIPTPYKALASLCPLFTS